VTKIINGRDVSKSILAELKAEISGFKSSPGLAVILVGDNPASKAYIGMKKKACEDLGVKSFEFILPAEATESELKDLLESLNQRNEVNGILLQMPLPKHLDEQKMLELIHPSKDVDGFHPVNVGKLLIGLDSFKSCTPYGVVELLKRYEIETSGKHVVILGRSNIVGKPMAAMLVQNCEGGNATVTICHSRTANLKQITNSADILIAAIGKPEFVSKDMVKDDAVVIDVGINRVDDQSSEKGYKLVGDVDYESVKDKTSAITPVPGGVGPLTIAMLMTNTVKAYLQTNS